MDGRKSTSSRCHAVRAVIMFTHFDLCFLKDRALLGPPQPCKAAGTGAWLNLGAKYSWTWLAGDCLAAEALDNCVTGIKSLPNVKAQTGVGGNPLAPFMLMAEIVCTG